MLTLVVLTILLFLLSVYLWKKSRRLPPGPWGLPIIGYFPLYTQDIAQIVKGMQNQYGDVFWWKIGSMNNVILCNPKTIKTVFSKPECQARPHLYGFDIFNFSSNTGLIRSTGYIWPVNRRFALRHLKVLGMGKSTMEDIIQNEAIILTKTYEDTAGKVTDFEWDTNVAVLNVIWKLVADRRYDIDSGEIRKFNKLHTDSLAFLQGPMLLLDIFPELQKILPNAIVNRWMKVADLRDNVGKFKDFFMEIIKDHVATFDPENPRDYIDAYLKEIQNERDNLDTVFKDDYENLVSCIASFFRAGSETVSSTMRWIVALLATHPEVQDRVQREIDNVIPSDRAPSLQDRGKMPYTEATILESLRVSSLVAIGVPHMNTEDISIEGYHVPKGTLIYASAVSCHRDPQYWEKPNRFYPEHFLDENGKLIMKKEGFLPFSLGRRQCLGENMARVELYFLTTCLLQKLSAAPPKGKIMKAEAIGKSNFLLNIVKPYKVVFTKRYNNNV